MLIEWNVIGEDAYVRRLARHHGLAFEDFRDLGRADCLLTGRQFVYAAQTGILPVRIDGSLVWIIAPRHTTTRMLAEGGLKQASADGGPIRLTTSERFNDFIDRAGRSDLADCAVEGLRLARPDLSAAPRGSAADNLPAKIRSTIRAAAGPLVIVGALLLLPLLQFSWPGILLSVAFLSFAALRVVGACRPPKTHRPAPRIADRDLPVYSVVAGLYREAKSVGKLIRFIRAMDYPPEKLQIILALEPDDLATRAAIARLGAIPNLQIVLAPNAGPRTKPKALNYALPFVRGSFVAVYDAEDEPEPGQLRDALRAFRNHGPEIACVQASLCITNGPDGWLTRTFAAEYAGQFDVFLQGASALRLPLPLGGSSNHFRTDVLREAGAWDPYNVTEDADLGLRLARLGYHSVMFASTTREEAPAFFMAWLKQRTRWMKGWMQTWAVHMRAPMALYRDIGLRGFIAINLLVGGNVLSALAYPCLLGTLAFNAGQYWTGSRSEFVQDWSDALHLAAAASGFAVTIGMGLAGLRKRGLMRHAWVLALTPVYWMVLSAAAWRALWQFVVDPYRWEKTEHGLAQSNHFAETARQHSQSAGYSPKQALS